MTFLAERGLNFEIASGFLKPLVDCLEEGFCRLFFIIQLIPFDI